MGNMVSDLSLFVINMPDVSICEWWDWQQPNGKVIRIKYMSNWYVKDWDKNYCWHSVERAYTEKSLMFIGGKFKPVPLTTDF
jgi:hypothetical protein